MAENIELLNQTEFAGTVMLNNGHEAKILLDTFSEIVRFLIEILLKQLFVEKRDFIFYHLAQTFRMIGNTLA